MRIVLVGPGRAGTALSLAARRAGHDVVAVAGRNRLTTAAASELLEASACDIGDPLPACDLLVIAVTDDAIASVAAAVSPAEGTAAAVHLSGAVSTEALAPLRRSGLLVGSLHPLQTLPTPEVGADRLAGAWVAVTASNEDLGRLLRDLATSLGCMPFSLDDADKPLYHAGAAAAANFPLVALAMAEDLFVGAGVPWEAARPLVEAVVANAFSLGPRAALTGPVARGDVDTVRRQIEAVADAAPEWRSTFEAFVAETAAMAGTDTAFGESGG